MTINDFLFEVKNALNKLNDEDKDYIKSTKDGGELHFSLGMWLRNNWNLWRGGPMVDFFKEHGIWHADDMSAIILCSYTRMLKNEDVKFEEQVQFYKDYWAKNKVQE
jgi:hypothetical protein